VFRGEIRYQPALPRENIDDFDAVTRETRSSTWRQVLFAVAFSLAYPTFSEVSRLDVDGGRKLHRLAVEKWCARLSLACLVDESSIMLIARSTCSEIGDPLGNGVGRSPMERILEPQRKRIRFGLVKPYLTVVIPPLWVKPVISAQATSVCEREAVRGGRERREEKDKPRNLGDPFGWDKTQLIGRMHKAFGARSEVGHVHSSQEAGNDRGAKERDRGLASVKSRSSA
jgi:hypothetical protein